MQHNEFIDIFKDVIQSDSDIAMDSTLEGIEEWDSMAMMALIAYFDVKLGITVTFDQLHALKCVRDVALLIPGFEA
jgi:acyl carrier protein